MEPMSTKLKGKPLTDVEKAQKAAELLNATDREEPIRAFWDALDEPRREEMLTYFAEWDRRFCESLNPAQP